MVGMDAQKPLAERPTAISNSIMRIRPEDLKAGLRDRYIIMLIFYTIILEVILYQYVAALKIA